MTETKKEEALETARRAFYDTVPGSAEEKSALEKWVALYDTYKGRCIPFSAYQRRQRSAKAEKNHSQRGGET